MNKMKFTPIDKERYVLSEHTEIDAQQTGFIDIANDYFRAFNTMKGAMLQNLAFISLMENTLNAISDYSRRHFITQEAMMALNSYPGIDKHIKQHNEYVQKIARAYKAHREYKHFNDEKHLKEVALQIGALLSDWFELHIDDVDRRLTEYMRYEKKEF